MFNKPQQERKAKLTAGSRFPNREETQGTQGGGEGWNDGMLSLFKAIQPEARVVVVVE